MDNSYQDKDLTKSTMHLITECITGNSTACKQLYQLYKVKSYAICLRYMRYKEESEDMFQEGWIKVFKKLGQYDEAKGAFGGWLSKIFVNTCLEQLRKRKFELQDLNETVHIISNDADIISDMTTEEMMKVLQSLPTGYRTVFNLYVIEGYNHREIAKALDISESTSKTQLMKAKAAMRERITIAHAV